MLFLFEYPEWVCWVLVWYSNTSRCKVFCAYDSAHTSNVFENYLTSVFLQKLVEYLSSFSCNEHSTPVLLYISGIHIPVSYLQSILYNHMMAKPYITGVLLSIVTCPKAFCRNLKMKYFPCDQVLIIHAKARNHEMHCSILTTCGLY